MIKFVQEMMDIVFELMGERRNFFRGREQNYKPPPLPHLLAPMIEPVDALFPYLN